MEYFELLRQHYGIDKDVLLKVLNMSKARYTRLLNNKGFLNDYIKVADFYELNTVEVNFIPLNNREVNENYYIYFINATRNRLY